MNRIAAALMAGAVSTAFLGAPPAGLAAQQVNLTTTSAPAVEFVSSDAVLRWIYGYRKKPEPGRVPAAIRAVSEAGALKDPETAGVYTGFLAGVIANQAGGADRFLARLFPVPSADEWIVIRAIAYSGHPEWKELLARTAAKMPQHSLMIERYASGKAPTLAQFSIDGEPGTWDKVRGYLSFRKETPKPVRIEASPEIIDTFWGLYFATGERTAILRIVSLLPWSKDRDKVDRLTIGSMAKYTLAANASRDPALLGLLKDIAAHQTGDDAAILKDTIEAAETVDVGRVRKEALAAIEELKKKGPGYKRDLSLWGQIGEGAISLGCIAAAAVGQVVLGVPCVVGGAATSAALRYWEKQD